ncbi:MAG TPA: hypothetical protein VM432_04140, partial [Bdellovibrionales bacterium]|nr:hypothetical protein [Bdellovibrionales bacterium]
AIGLATSLKRRHSNPVKFICEASSPKEVEGILRDVGLDDSIVFAKSTDDVVPFETVETLKGLSRDGAHVILAGRAQSIQQMKIHLKSWAFPMSNVTTKVYWSEGKRGLD